MMSQEHENSKQQHRVRTPIQLHTKLWPSFAHSCRKEPASTTAAQAARPSSQTMLGTSKLIVWPGMIKYSSQTRSKASSNIFSELKCFLLGFLQDSKNIGGRM